MGMWELLTHPKECLAVLLFKLCPDLVLKSSKDEKHLSPTLKRCYELLRMTGRSCALLVPLLDNPLRDYFSLTYLLLRGLDAIEEDLTIPTEKRVAMLKSYYKSIDDPHWSYPNSNDRHGIVLKEHPIISCEVRKLPKDQKERLVEVCQKTGETLAKYLVKEIVSLDDFLEHCETLSLRPTIAFLQVAVEQVGENETVLEDSRLLKEASHFFTAINPVKDIYEDLLAGCIRWPKSMWGKYVDNPLDLTHPKNKEKALAFLNEMVLFCLKRFPHAVLFTSHLNENKTFRFFAVHEVMGIATLERMYNNYQAYSGAVKIRKGEAIRLTFEVKSLNKVKAICHHYVEKIMRRIPDEDPNAAETRLACQRALVACRTKVKFETQTKVITICSVGFVLMVSLIFACILVYFKF